MDSGQIKTGSLSRSERIAKYNQLLRIEDQNNDIKFSGKEPFKNFFKCLKIKIINSIFFISNFRIGIFIFFLVKKI